MLALNKVILTVKTDISYLGYVNRTPPIVIAFEKLKHGSKVHNNLTLYNYDVRYHPYKHHFKLERNLEKPVSCAYYIEAKTCESFQTHLDKHNIDMFIVNGMIEDEDNNLTLFNKDSKRPEDYL